MDLKTFKQKFHELEKRGFVKSQRTGNTGVGHTLESLLGISENNIALSDLDVAELKGHRKGSNSLITLFTLDRGAWLVNQLHAIRKYGLVDSSGRPNLYMTLYNGRGSGSLSLTVDSSGVTVSDRSGTVVAKWKLSDLAQSFEKKFPALMYVVAKVEVRGGTEWFHYESATLLKGTSSKKMLEGIKKGWIAIDLRLHDNNGSTRNHGTGFRIMELDFPKLFEERIEI